MGMPLDRSALVVVVLEHLQHLLEFLNGFEGYNPEQFLF